MIFIKTIPNEFEEYLLFALGHYRSYFLNDLTI